MEKIIKRVQKLLEVTIENGATEEEALNAVDKVHKLLAKHHLSMKDVEVTEEQSIEDRLLDYNVRTGWGKNLAHLIAKKFRCEILFSSNRHKNRIRPIFVGEALDVEVASQTFANIFDFMHRRAKSVHRRHKNNNMQTVGVIESYKDGFVTGLAMNFRKEELETDQETALVMSIPKEVSDTANNMSKGYLNHKSPSTVFNHQAYRNGTEDGKGYGKEIQ